MRRTGKCTLVQTVSLQYGGDLGPHGTATLEVEGSSPTSQTVHLGACTSVLLEVSPAEAKLRLLCAHGPGQDGFVTAKVTVKPDPKQQYTVTITHKGGVTTSVTLPAGIKAVFCVDEYPKWTEYRIVMK